jgi:hypothetical protein
VVNVADLMTALRNAHNAGDTEAANRIAQMIKAQGGATQPTVDIKSLEEIGGAPELNELSVPAFKASLGLLSTGDDKSLRGIFKQQFGDNVSFDDVDGATVVNLPSGQYVMNKPGISGQDVVKFISDALAFTPAGRAKTLGGAALGAGVTELGLEVTEKALGGEDVDAKEVATAAALGGAFKGVEDLIGAGYRAFKGTTPQAQRELIEEGEEAGIRLMTSDLLQPQTFVGKTAQQTAEKIPFAGTGAQREIQQQFRQDAIEDLANRYNQFSYSAIVDSLRNSGDKVKSAAGNVLNRIGQQLDEAGEIPLENTRTAISEVKEELGKAGVIRNDAALADLQVLIDAINEAPQTFSTLKENRTAFRDIIKGFDKSDRSQLGTRANALLTKVKSAITKDMDSFAKQNLNTREYNRWKKANSVYAGEAEKLTKTRLKNALDKGDVTPEAVSTMLFSQKPSELKILYSSLGADGRKNARAAIISKIVDNVSKRAGGLTPNAFLTEFKKFEPQVNQFFKGQEKKQLLGLQKVLDATRRAQDAAISTPTGQQLTGAVTLGAAATDLGLTTLLGGSVGGFARLYESAPVRNALIRLSSVQKGSTKFEQALREAQTALSSASQALRDEQQGT